MRAVGWGCQIYIFDRPWPCVIISSIQPNYKLSLYLTVEKSCINHATNASQA